MALHCEGIPDLRVDQLMEGLAKEKVEIRVRLR